MSRLGHFLSLGSARITSALRCALACAALVLAACVPPQPGLSVGLNSWVGYDPLVVARDERLLDPQQVKVVELSSSSDTLRHFRNGLIDAAALTLDETLRLADEGVDLRIIALMDASNGADVVMSQPGLTRLEQLRGARIAVESTTVGALMLERLLQAARLPREAVEVLHLEATGHLTALKSQRVDVAVSYEPVAGALRQAGYHALFDSSQMPGDIVDVLVVRAEVLIHRPQQVDALLNAWAQGLQRLQADPQTTVQWLAPAVELTPQAYLSALAQLRFYTLQDSLGQLSGEPSSVQQGADSLTQLLLQMGLLDQPPDWSRLVDVAPLRRVLTKGRQP